MLVAHLHRLRVAQKLSQTDQRHIECLASCISIALLPERIRQSRARHRTIASSNDRFQQRQHAARRPPRELQGSAVPFDLQASKRANPDHPWPRFRSIRGCRDPQPPDQVDDVVTFHPEAQGFREDRGDHDRIPRHLGKLEVALPRERDGLARAGPPALRVTVHEVHKGFEEAGVAFQEGEARTCDHAPEPDQRIVKAVEVPDHRQRGRLVVDTQDLDELHAGLRRQSGRPPATVRHGDVVSRDALDVDFRLHDVPHIHRPVG